MQTAGSKGRNFNCEYPAGHVLPDHHGGPDMSTRSWRTVFNLLFLLIVFPAPHLPAEQATIITVGDFSSGSLQGWEEKEFLGNTKYTLVDSGSGGVLKATSSGSASGLFLEREIDLRRTPFLNWSWKIENTLGELNEQSKPGDDYPARIYVVKKGGIAFWTTRALNYVWASTSPAGTAWPNAFTDNAMMFAVRSGDAQVGDWVHEKRNIREDYKRLFGKDVETIDAVALMTDTDNAGGRATAWYGDIYFSAE
jgi:hypothetical protein